MKGPCSSPVCITDVSYLLTDWLRAPECFLLVSVLRWNSASVLFYTTVCTAVCPSEARRREEFSPAFSHFPLLCRHREATYFCGCVSNLTELQNFGTYRCVNWTKRRVHMEQYWKCTCSAQLIILKVYILRKRVA